MYTKAEVYVNLHQLILRSWSLSQILTYEHEVLYMKARILGPWRETFRLFKVCGTGSADRQILEL